MARTKPIAWTPAKVQKKLLASRIKCPRAIYFRLAGRPQNEVDYQLHECAQLLNPKYQQIVDCGVTSACDLQQCCHDGVVPVTEQDYTVAKWMVDTHNLGQPIAWAKCLRAGRISFTCGVQLKEVTDATGVTGPNGDRFWERFCLSVTTRPKFTWKARAAFSARGPTDAGGAPVPGGGRGGWVPQDPGVCSQLAKAT